MGRFGIGPGPGAVRRGGPCRRLRRRWGLEHNDLRRRVDRVQRAVALGLLVLLLCTAPPLAASAAAWSYQAGTQAERAERAARHRVIATVVSTGGLSSGDRYIHETVRATWTDAAGRAHTGTLPSWKNAKTGATRAIWIDRGGDPTVRPRPHSRTITDAVYAGTAAVLACAMPVLLLYALVRRECDRRRDAAWDAAWARMDAALN